MEKNNKFAMRITIAMINAGFWGYILLCLTGYCDYRIVLLGFLLTIPANIMMSSEYKKNKASERLMYMMCVFLTLHVNLLVFATRIEYIYVAGYIISLVSFIYLNKKIILLMGLLMSATNFVGLMIIFITKKTLAGEPYNRILLYAEIAVWAVYIIILGVVSDIMTKYDVERINRIQQANIKNEKMMEKMVSIADYVRENAKKGNEHIVELDTATDNSFNIYKEISRGNINNAKSVEEQARMTSNIMSLIDKVVADTKSAMNATNNSINGLQDSTKSIVQIKDKSTELIGFNKEVLDAINDFVANARNVKNITDGINDISEQTNLLSLNASIESARAGEAGKGFAVVADEIRKLADETGSLTRNIDKIVISLEKNAIKAQSVVEKVVDAIVEENVTIDDAMNKFLYMRNDIESLNDDMKNILDSTSEVVTFNERILEHAEKLSASTEEVSAFAEEALGLMEENKKKTVETKEIIRELVEVSEDLRN